MCTLSYFTAKVRFFCDILKEKKKKTGFRILFFTILFVFTIFFLSLAC